MHVSLAWQRRREAIELYLGLFAPDGTPVVKSILRVGERGPVEAGFDLTLSPLILPTQGLYLLRLIAAARLLSQRTLSVHRARSLASHGDVSLPETPPRA